jgi:hypothetical protein
MPAVLGVSIDTPIPSVPAILHALAHGGSARRACGFPAISVARILAAISEASQGRIPDAGAKSNRVPVPHNEVVTIRCRADLVVMLR